MQVATQQPRLVAEIRQKGERFFSCCALTPSEVLGDKNTFFSRKLRNRDHKEQTPKKRKKKKRKEREKRKRSAPTHWRGRLQGDKSRCFAPFSPCCFKMKRRICPESFASPPSAALKQFSFFLCAGQVAQTAGVSAQLSKLTHTLNTSSHTHIHRDTVRQTRTSKNFFPTSTPSTSVPVSSRAGRCRDSRSVEGLTSLQ